MTDHTAGQQPDGVDKQASTETEGAAQPSKPAKNHKGRRQMDDAFMMTMYKIKMCTRTTAHNWKLCPWAHPGETAALRRHPSCHLAEMCPAVRQHQECPHGYDCLYSRNIFEAFLHPHRYRTTMCSAGEACTRNICFFAHNEQELRRLPDVTEWPTPLSTAHAQQQLLLNAGTLQDCPQQPQLLSTGTGLMRPADVPGSLVGLLPVPGFAHQDASLTKPSPASNRSSPLPASTLAIPTGTWCPVPAAAGSASASTVAAGLHMQQLQLLQQQSAVPQPMLRSQQVMAVPACSVALPRNGSNSGLLPPRAGLMPIASPAVSQPAVLAECSSSGVLCSIAPSQDTLLQAGQQRYQSYQGVLGTLPVAEGSHAALGSVQPVIQGRSAAGDNLHMGAMQQSTGIGVVGANAQWQQQQQHLSVQQAALLLQRMQLSGSLGPSSMQLSTESLPSSLLQNSASTVPLLSHISMSDLSTDSLATMLPPGCSSSQELGVNSAARLNALLGTTDLSGLLPLETSGVIQFSALDEAALLADQPKHMVTTPMQQPGMFW